MNFADNPEELIGVWRLVSLEAEFQDTGERELFLGKNPSGYTIFTPEGRMMTVITGEGRESPRNDEQRSDLYNSLVAYTGTYHIEGDKFITKVDVAWNPEWVGTERVRYYKLDGERLHITTTWFEIVSHPEKRMGKAILTWERAK